MKSTHLAAAFAVVALTLTGCGTGSTQTTARPAPSTMAETTPSPTASTAPRPIPTQGPVKSKSSGSSHQVASCPTVGGMPSGATAITIAPVDFNGDNVADTFRVYRVGATWHARAQIAGVAVSDVVVVGQGPSMTAIGGATINNDTKQEAWIKVGSGSSTDLVSFFVFRQCGLQRVRLNNSPAAFPVGATVMHADGIQCYGFNVGIEVFKTNSTDGITFTGTSKIYTINLSGAAPTLVLGATATQSESNPPGGNAFDVLSRFTCDNLGPSIP
jgi:hypothetical protein